MVIWNYINQLVYEIDNLRENVNSIVKIFLKLSANKKLRIRTMIRRMHQMMKVKIGLIFCPKYILVFG